MPRVLLAEYSVPDISGELPSVMKRAGCEVHVYAPKESWLLKNASWDRWFPADIASPERYATGVAARAAEGAYDWVVFTEDKALRAVEAHVGDRESIARLFPVRDPAHRGLMGSKAALSILAERYGLPTPRFKMVSNGETAREAAGALGYPLVMKIDKSGGGGQGVFMCADEASLRDTLGRLTPEQKEGLIVQAYVAGHDIAVEALFREGELVACASSRVAMTVGGAFGVSSVRLYERREEAERSLERAGRAFGIHGFCNATFREEEGTGKLFLIEADVRPNIWIALDRFAGVDFAEAVRAFLSGTSIPLRQPQKSARISVRHFHRDLNHAIEHGDWRNILAWLCNRGWRWRFTPWRDPRLFAACVGAIVRRQGEVLATRYRFVRRMKDVLRHRRERQDS